MRKCMALILVLTIMGSNCLAEIQLSDSDIAQKIMICVFAAASGTNAETEMTLQEDMTEEEKQQRIKENAVYRETVLPWLAESLVREEETEKAVEAMDENDETVDPETAAKEERWQVRLDAAYEAMSGNDEGKAYLEILSALGAQNAKECLTLTQRYFQVWLSEIEPDRLKTMNEDFAFWLYSPGSPIDYPVVQTEDNRHYLHRMFNGERNSAGTLFVDCRNLPNMQDPNTLVYGHHMRNDSMFGSLEWYQEQAYYDSHPYMLVVAEDAIYIIELFCGYTTDKHDACYDIAISDEEDMAEFVETAIGKSDFVCCPEMYTDDRLITLSTCAYAFENARYIVIGRLMSALRLQTIETNCPKKLQTD